MPACTIGYSAPKSFVTRLVNDIFKIIFSFLLRAKKKNQIIMSVFLSHAALLLLNPGCVAHCRFGSLFGIVESYLLIKRKPGFKPGLLFTIHKIFFTIHNKLIQQYVKSDVYLISK